MEYILFFVGFLLLVRGADWLVDGASALASKLGVSPLVIGLTVVAFGTSLPELIVSLFAASSSAEIAIGNVLGSNIANILLVLGIVAIIHPLTVHRTTVYREILLNIGAAVMLAVLISERFLSEGGFYGLDHVDGIVLISYFIIFLYFTFGRTTVMAKQAEKNVKQTPVKDIALPNTLAKIALGSLGLWVGGVWIVNGAVSIATFLGVSDALIGLTIVALGTSLPELTTSIVAVRKGNVDIAVGNIVGSNLFNIFWVLGLSALITPLPFNDELIFDVFFNIIVALLLFGTMVFGKYRHQVSKSEGKIFITIYICYLLFIIFRG